MLQPEPEPFEVLGAPPVVSLSSIASALSPAIAPSLARHPEARAGFIGMHLLSQLDGSQPPDAPPLAPRPEADMRSEIRMLEKILSDALNFVRGEGPRDNHSLMRRLALRLVDQMDADRHGRFLRYSDPQSIWDQVASGDVVLVRSSWLLHRAGYRPAAHSRAGCVRAWVSREPPQPLPRRQELERDFPEAIMPLDELKRNHRKFIEIAREAQGMGMGAPRDTTALDDGVEAMPVLSVSHCWETPHHPDPQGRTLRIVAAELADGAWEAFDERGMPAGAPTSGLPLYRCWGFEDVGVFWDWCSLHQAPRTEVETACFRRAFSQQDVYFAHTLVTSFILQCQPEAHLQVARDRRGWPYYEEASSMLLKRSPPLNSYELPYHESVSESLLFDAPLIAPCWSKVVSVTRPDGGPTISHTLVSRTYKRRPQAAIDDTEEHAPDDLLASKAERAQAAKERARGAQKRIVAQRDHNAAIRDEAAAYVKISRAKSPPLSPSRFAEVLRSKAFADGTDCGAIAGLYRAVMEDGFGGLEYLRLAGCGWGDCEVEHLAQTVSEVRTSRLVALDLSNNEAWTDGEALAEACLARRAGGLLSHMPFRTLKLLTLCRCTALRSLPTTIDRLAALEVLDCAGCESLESLPASLVELTVLHTLVLSDCFALAALPPNFQRLSSLTHLNLDYCDALTAMPDLSASRHTLHVELLPDRLAAWETGDRHAYDFMASGPHAQTTTVDLSFLGTRTLPRWLVLLPMLTSLNLTGCDVLDDLNPIRSLARLCRLRLSGCSALTSLDGANLSALSSLTHLELKGCDGLLTLPDLSALANLNVVGLAAHLQPWVDGGRIAWVYDPNAPKLAPAPLLSSSASLVPSYQELVASQLMADDLSVPPLDSTPAAKPMPQRLELSNLEWGDAELYKVAEALEKGGSINGKRVDAGCLVALDLRDNIPVRSSNVLGRVIEKLPALESLSLSGCVSLQGVPDTIGYMGLASTLTELDINGCSSIMSLPDSICHLTHLTTLTLCNGIKGLPEDFGCLSALRILNAPHLYAVRQLPTTFVQLTALEELDMQGWSSLQALPNEFFHLPRLRALNLGSRPFHAPLNALPPSIGDCSTLESLDLQSWLNLYELPESIGELHALRSLTLGGCTNLATLPASIGKLSRLESLDLGLGGIWGGGWTMGSTLRRFQRASESSIR